MRCDDRPIAFRFIRETEPEDRCNKMDRWIREANNRKKDATVYGAFESRFDADNCNLYCTQQILDACNEKCTIRARVLKESKSFQKIFCFNAVQHKRRSKKTAMPLLSIAFSNRNESSNVPYSKRI